MTSNKKEYSDPDIVWIYDFEYTETDDLLFYAECARRFGAPILELGSGTGRVSIPLAEEGFEVFGIEASDRMIEICEKKIAAADNPDLRIDITKGDMSSFDLGRTFPLIIIPVNSFLILDREGQRSCLECCRRHLDDGGALAIEVFNPFGPSRAFERSNEVEGIEKLVSTRPHPVSGKTVRRFVSQKRDFFNQLLYIENTYEVESENGVDSYSFTEKLRFVYESEMELMIEAAGMEIYRIFGWYDGRDFSPLSEIMLFVITR